MTVEAQKPGTIYALNEDTGVYMYVREEMLKDKTNFNFRRADVADLPQALAANVAPVAPEKPDVIQTKAGKPFKTEAAAKTAMKAQELSDMEYIVMPVDEGFIITKV
jgi:hypothetical protein